MQAILCEDFSILYLISATKSSSCTQINGKKVLSTDNAFRSYSISAKSHLQAGHNVLEIIIQPASEICQASAQ